MGISGLGGLDPKVRQAVLDLDRKVVPATIAADVFARLSGGATATSTGVLTVSAGHITNAMLSATAGEIGGAWTSYTPTFSSSGAPTLGTGGTATGQYMRFGKNILCRGSIQFGTAGAVAGTGTYTFGLPVASMTGAVTALNVGSVRATNLNTAGAPYNFMSSQAIILSGASTVSFYYPAAYPAGTDSRLSGTAPNAPVINNATLSLNGRYEFAVLYETA